ncbi:hypothetical protein BRADI_5g25885v3 [Brachypodium distachyon]|uniref:Uncharacterized protein n=1 Tax=Brachypodium distachyon TaxID=15368 RepID=A0A2K2CJB1_BRADI|nr:hypothetical protein BRADI_5g25885v3 [Brachypodium distachyon]
MSMMRKEGLEVSDEVPAMAREREVGGASSEMSFLLLGEIWRRSMLRFPFLKIWRRVCSVVCWCQKPKYGFGTAICPTLWRPLSFS